MTRTERAAYPRAVKRDRSESKSGMDKSVRKGGAGSHNWGAIPDEVKHEYGAMDDEELEYEQSREEESRSPSESTETDVKKPDLSRSSSVLSNEELESARQIRKNALKSPNVDLATIARTSYAISNSGPKSATSISSDAQIETLDNIV